MLHLLSARFKMARTKCLAHKRIQNKVHTTQERQLHKLGIRFNKQMRFELGFKSVNVLEMVASDGIRQTIP